MLTLFARFRRARKPQAPDAFDRRLGLLQLRVPARLPSTGMSVFRMMP